MPTICHIIQSMFDQSRARDIVSTLFSKYDFNKSETLEGDELGGFFNQAFLLLRLPITVTKDQVEDALKTSKGYATKQDLYNALSLIYMNRKRNAFQPQQPISQDPKYQLGLQTGFMVSQGLNLANMIQPGVQPGLPQPGFLGTPQISQLGIPQNLSGQQMHTTGYPPQYQQSPPQQPQYTQFQQGGIQPPQHYAPVQAPQFQQPPPQQKQQFRQPPPQFSAVQQQPQQYQPPQQQPPANLFAQQQNFNNPPPPQTPYNQYPQQQPQYPPPLSNQPPQQGPPPQFQSQQKQQQQQPLTDYELDNKIRNYVNLLYQKYDVDNSGGLDVQELGNVFNQIMGELGISTTFTVQETINLIQKIDKNKNGRIEKYQLYTCLRNMMDGKKMDS